MKFKSSMVNSGNANLGHALAFSLVLHGLLLWQVQPAALAPQHPKQPQANYLNASLSPRATAESLAAVAISSAASEVKPGAIRSSRTAEAMPHMPPRQAMALAAHSPGSSGGALAELEGGAPGELGGGAPGELGGGVPAELGSGVPLPVVLARDIDPLPVEAGVDANGLRQYRLRLAAAARRFKLYPPQAQENGWSGTAEVRVAIAANGVPQPPQLLRSSGHQLLDAVALDMLGNAALRTAVPASLRGQSFSVPLPVVFDLNDE